MCHKARARGRRETDPPRVVVGAGGALCQVLGLAGVGGLGRVPGVLDGVERGAVPGRQGGQVQGQALVGAVMEAGGGGQSIEAAVLLGERERD